MEIDVTVYRAFTAAWRNVLPALGALVVALVAYVLSVCTLVGWVVGLPMLVWGFTVFVLEAESGRARVPAVWSAWPVLGRAVSQMWLYIFVYILPVSALNMAPTLAWNLRETGVWFPVSLPNPIVPTLVSITFGLIVGVLLCRLSLATYFLVERRQNVFAALGSSWSVTGPVWGRMVALMLVTAVLLWPASGLIIGSQWVERQIQLGYYDPAWRTPAQIAQIVSMVLLLGLGFVAKLVYASAYRQLSGPPPHAGA